MAIVSAFAEISNVNNGTDGTAPIAFYSANPTSLRPTTIPYSTEWTHQDQLNPDVDYNWVIWGPNDFSGGVAPVYRATATGTAGVETEIDAGDQAVSVFSVVDGTTTPLRTNETSEKYTVSISGDTSATIPIDNTTVSAVNIQVPGTSINETISLIDNTNPEVIPPIDRDWTLPWNQGNLSYRSGSLALACGAGEFRTDSDSNELRFDLSADLITTFPYSNDNQIPLETFLAWHGLSTLANNVQTTLRNDSQYVLRFEDNINGDVVDVTYTSIEFISSSSDYIIRGGIVPDGFSVNNRAYTPRFMRRADPGIDFVMHSETLVHNDTGSNHLDDAWSIYGEFSGTRLSLATGYGLLLQV